MFKTLSRYEFHDAFNASAEHTPHSFSYVGLNALYDYITEFEDETADSFEFDLVALRCEYTEYPSLADAASSYGMGTAKLWENTPVIELKSGGVIIADF